MDMWLTQLGLGGVLRMTAKIEFSAEQVEAMKEMRRNGKSWMYLAKSFNCSTATVRRLFGVAFNNRRYYDSRLSLRALNLEPLGQTRAIPNHVIAERDVRLATEPRDLTASFFGDPLPGWSALDRKG